VCLNLSSKNEGLLVIWESIINQPNTYVGITELINVKLYLSEETKRGYKYKMSFHYSVILEVYTNYLSRRNVSELIQP